MISKKKKTKKNQKRKTEQRWEMGVPKRERERKLVRKMMINEESEWESRGMIEADCYQGQR